MIILLNENYLDEYYNLIKQLVSNINYDKKKLIDYYRNNNKKIYLLVKDNKIVGTGSLLIEKKIYHNFKNIKFYEKCDFLNKNVEMVKYNKIE